MRTCIPNDNPLIAYLGDLGSLQRQSYFPPPPPKIYGLQPNVGSKSMNLCTPKAKKPGSHSSFAVGTLDNPVNNADRPGVLP